MNELMYVVRNDNGAYIDIDNFCREIKVYSLGFAYDNLKTAKEVCDKYNAQRIGSTFKVYEVKLELVP
jgi:hypothetical protein